MKVRNVDSNVYLTQNDALRHSNARLRTAYFNAKSLNSVSPKQIAFKKGGSDITKRSWMLFRQLSDNMKEKSEMKSALIALVGTGGIAPFAIMMSPGKGKKKGEAAPTEEEKKAAKEKKFFQALRQPISAGLAFGFQLPTTLGIAKLFDYLAYKKHYKVFKDEIIGDLVPSKDYLKKQAKKVLKGSGSSELKAEWAEELKIAEDSEKITAELINKLKSEYEEVGIEISDEKLRKLANKKSKRNKYIAEKMAEAKHTKLLEEKVVALQGKDFKINNLDLVTEKYQDLAKHRFKADYDKLEKDAKLSWFDSIVKSMGFSNKKLKKLGDAQKAFAKEKGLELLQQDNPGILEDKAAKFKKFVETKAAAAQKVHGNKIFWFTLVTNLFMVAVSCTALNWLHPKFADFVDGIKLARKEEAERKQAQKQAIQEQTEGQKVKVSA